jgi:hypothetical protein
MEWVPTVPEPPVRVRRRVAVEFFPKWAKALIGGGKGKHDVVGKPPADELQANREPVTRKSSRHRDCRLTRHIEWNRERQPAVERDRLAGYSPWRYLPRVCAEN